MKHVILSLLLFVSFLGLTNTTRAQEVPAIVFRGPITPQSAKSFLDTLNKHQSLQVVRITSNGGNVDSALDMAEAIRSRRMDVEVDGDCLSSCANYIFMAGKNKYIKNDAIVAWHGNIIHLNHLNRISEQVIRSANIETSSKNAKREVAFFKSLGVDQFICWFGKMSPYSTKKFYTISISDMEKFGIYNIYAPENYPLNILSKRASGLPDIAAITVHDTIIKQLKRDIPESNW